MMTMRTLISKVNQINRSIAVINNRLTDIDYNLTETERIRCLILTIGLF